MFPMFRPLIFRLLILLVVVTASKISMLLENLNPGQARTIEDVSREILQNHDIIHLEQENSILTSSLYLGPNLSGASITASSNSLDALQNVYILMEYLPNSVIHEESNPTSIRGCFDNRHSSTTSSVAKTYGTNTFTSAGPRLFVQFLGVELGLSFNIMYDVIREEKFTCSVGPGERLQLQVSTTTTKLHLKRQRLIKFEPDDLSSGYLSSPWQTLNSSHSLEFSSSVVTCTTDERYLNC